MKNDSDMLEVRQVCSLTGATARQLRTWDARGLLHAVRTGEQIANNRKLFSADDVERVRDILLLRKLGLGLDDIRIILEAPDEEAARILRDMRRCFVMITRAFRSSSGFPMRRKSSVSSA